MGELAGSKHDGPLFLRDCRIEHRLRCKEQQSNGENDTIEYRIPGDNSTSKSNLHEPYYALFFGYFTCRRVPREPILLGTKTTNPKNEEAVPKVWLQILWYHLTIIYYFYICEKTKYACDVTCWSYLGHGVVGGRTDWTLNLDTFPFLYLGNSGWTSFQVVHLNELRIGSRGNNVRDDVTASNQSAAFGNGTGFLFRVFLRL
jgi:hypothetical protein